MNRCTPAIAAKSTASMKRCAPYEAPTQRCPDTALPRPYPPDIPASSPPYFHATHGNENVTVEIRSGSGLNLINESTAESLGLEIIIDEGMINDYPDCDKMHQHRYDINSADDIIGLTSFSLYRGGLELLFEGLVVDDKCIDTDIIAGAPFMESNDLFVRPARHLITFSDDSVFTYGCRQGDTREAASATICSSDCILADNERAPAESQDTDLSPWVPYISSAQAQHQVMENAIDLQHTAKQLLMQIIVRDSPGALECDSVHGSLAPVCPHPVTPDTIVVAMASPHSTSEQDPPEVTTDSETVSGHPGSCTSPMVASPQQVAHSHHVCLPHHALECGTVSTDAAESPELTPDLSTMVLTNNGPPAPAVGASYLMPGDAISAPPAFFDLSSSPMVPQDPPVLIYKGTDPYVPIVESRDSPVSPTTSSSPTATPRESSGPPATPDESICHLVTPAECASPPVSPEVSNGSWVPVCDVSPPTVPSDVIIGPAPAPAVNTGPTPVPPSVSPGPSSDDQHPDVITGPAPAPAVNTGPTPMPPSVSPGPSSDDQHPLTGPWSPPHATSLLAGECTLDTPVRSHRCDDVTRMLYTHQWTCILLPSQDGSCFPLPPAPPTDTPPPPPPIPWCRYIMCISA